MTPLLAETHGHLGYKPVSDFSFARRVTRLPLAVWEIVRTAQVMPVVFEKLNGRWQAVAIMGPSQGLNAHVSPTGHWCADVVPITFRLHPFCMDAEGKLCLAEGVKAEDHDLPGAIPFFEDAALSPRLKQTFRYLFAHAKGLSGVDRTLDLLSRSKALLPLETVMARRPLLDANAEKSFVLDAERLAALDDATILILFKSGALRWLHAHLDSLHHLDQLDRKARAVIAAHQPRASDRAAAGPASDVVSALAEDVGDADFLSITKGGFA